MTSRMNSLIEGKATVERKLQAVGGQIRKNVDQGQADLKAGRIPEHGAINPLRGTRTAFRKG